MKKTIVALAAILSTILPMSMAQADEPAKPNLVLIGDSIAGGSLYGNEWAWPKAVNSSLGTELKNYSSPGTGIIKASTNCTIASYPARLYHVTQDAPTYVIVEDGIGDSLRCSNGEYVKATTQQAKDVTDRFMRDLALDVQALGIPRDHVLIMTPTSQKVREFDWMRDQIETAAKRHSFTFIEPYLTVNQTVDGIHPNQKGHEFVTEVVKAAL